ncbi:hypothetical protein AGR4A_Lc1683 [Agrobacterium tumefaciens str. B6]|uniref:Uncharacterized protein n=1 Tax=Agrobacterium tumefaciens str. B6 TaxID=1183423 RepID=A0A822V623_AGRTU|nr:hypothetical protein AGR4A_Lc1683 [Agrobacterium tumefaciens str. B6]
MRLALATTAGQGCRCARAVWPPRIRSHGANFCLGPGLVCDVFHSLRKVAVMSDFVSAKRTPDGLDLAAFSAVCTGG